MHEIRFKNMAIQSRKCRHKLYSINMWTMAFWLLYVAEIGRCKEIKHRKMLSMGASGYRYTIRKLICAISK